jgi:hypothetical protein
MLSRKQRRGAERRRRWWWCGGRRGELHLVVGTGGGDAAKRAVRRVVLFHNRASKDTGETRERGSLRLVVMLVKISKEERRKISCLCVEQLPSLF